MKTIKLLISTFLFVLVALFGGSAQAYTYPLKPENGQFVKDQANLLRADQALALNKVLTEMMAQTGAPLIVVTVPTLSEYGATPDKIEEYGRSLFNTWGIGSAKTNKGALFLVAAQDRKMRIQMGSAYGYRYDSALDAVRDQTILPAFKNNDYAKGLIEGSIGITGVMRQALAATAEAPNVNEAQPVTSAGSPKTEADSASPTFAWDNISFLQWVLIILVFLGLSRYGRSHGWLWGIFLWMWLPWDLLWGFAVSLAGGSTNTDGGDLGGGGAFDGGSCDGGGGSTGDW